MARYYTFIIGGEMYQTQFVKKTSFDTLHIYKYNPKSIFFKRQLLCAPLVIDMMIEAQDHINGRAHNYYKLLAEFSVNKVIAKH